MKITQARVRIEKLRKELDYHNHLYFIEDRPELSDAQYDSLMQELRALEAVSYTHLTLPTILLV